MHVTSSRGRSRSGGGEAGLRNRPQGGLNAAYAQGEECVQDSVENLVTLFENGTLNRQQLIQGLLAAMAPTSMMAPAHPDTSTTSAFRGRSLNHVTLSVTDVERSQEFYLFKLGEPRVHHFCVAVENFSIDAALEKLKSDFPESKPIVYRGEELYFRDPDGILGQISGLDYRGPRKTALDLPL